MSLWIAGLCAAGQFAKIAIPFPEVSALNPNYVHQAGWLLSSISLMGALLGLSAGGLVVRFGAEKALMAGMLIGGALSILQAAGPDFGMLVFSRVLEGFSHILIVVAAPTLISRLAGDRYQNAAMALWSTFIGVSFALFGFYGIPLVTRSGPEALFLAHGLITLAVATTLLFVFPRNTGPSNPEETAADDHIFLSFTAHLLAYRSARIFAPGADWFFYTSTFVALLAVLPPLLPEALRQTVATAMPLVGIAVSLLIAPFMLRVWSSTNTVIIGFASAIASICALMISVPLAVLALLTFAAFGLVQGGSFAAVPELNSGNANRALSFGVVAKMGNLGNFIGTPALLFIFGNYGSGAMLAVAGCLYASAIMTLLGLSRRFFCEWK